MGCIFSTGEDDRNAVGIQHTTSQSFNEANAMEAAAFITGNGLTSRVELTISAKSLIDKDYLSKSDPFCVIYSKSASGAWEEVARTEIIANNLNPQW